MKYRWFCRRLLSVLLVCAALGADRIPARAAQTDEDSPESIESATAAVMQLMKTEGEVAVQNSSGRTISLIKNMNLYNGYHTITEESSYAWINLDSEKLTKLDAVSEAEVRKSGKKLEILLDSGNLFFDVAKPLTEDETMNIRTSTMVMGIRGTCGWVRVVDRWHSLVYILEGTVQCSVMDPVTNQIKSTTLSSGETAEFIVYSQDRIGDKCDIILRDFTEEDIDGFALTELVQDTALCQKIHDASGMELMGMAEQADRRLRDDQSQMHAKLGSISSRLEEQEHHVSLDPVWAGGDTGQEDTEVYDPADGTRDGTQSSDTGAQNAGQGAASSDTGGPAAEEGFGESSGGSGGNSSGSADSGSGGNSSGNPGSSAPADPGGSTLPGAGDNTPAEPAAPAQPPVTVSADDVSGSDINTQLSQDNVNQVVVEPGTGSSTLTVPSGTDMNIPSEKTLTVEEGATLEVQPGATVQVDGTLDVKGDLVNNGTIIVNNGG